jgi:hypothetical protein
VPDTVLLSLAGRRQMGTDILIHFEHVHLVPSAKEKLQFVVSNNHPFGLEPIRLDILPQLFNYLCATQWLRPNNCGQNRIRLKLDCEGVHGFLLKHSASFDSPFYQRNQQKCRTMNEYGQENISLIEQNLVIKRYEGHVSRHHL